MISIIICSRSHKELQKVTENVTKTIGVEFEIVAIDNSKNKFGICEAYNLGASQSKYDILCFMHEDLQFHTFDWGIIVAGILKDNSIGVIGVAGSKYVLNSPAPWWFGGEKNLCVNVMHTANEEHEVIAYKNYAEEKLAEVATVDGLWMCTRKDVWKMFPFDQKTFSQFHFYDLDFCTDVYTRFKICVTFDILIEHFSHGSINKSWVENALLYQRKRRKILPFGKSVYSQKENNEHEKESTRTFVYRLMQGGYSATLIIKYITEAMFYNPLDRDTLYLYKKLIIDTTAKKRKQ